MSYELLGFEALHASWDGRADAVRGVDGSVGEHEIVTILGSNGAGKTTLAMAAAGVVPFVRGRVRFAGEDLTGLRPHQVVERGLTVVPASRGVFGDQTVEENLLLGAHRHRRDRARVRRSMEQMLERFGVLAAARRSPAGTLSGGAQRILAIARGLMARPRLLVLDEPSAGLAPAHAREIFDLVRAVRAGGTTVVMIEKLARPAVALSDRLWVMELGRLTLAGAASELANDPRIEEAYLGRRAWARGFGDDGSG